jgi:hypothetical protein
MNVFVNLKSIGKRKKGLEKVPFTLPDGITTLRGLIDAVVRQEADSYNARGTDNMLIHFLTEENIEDKASVGKVGFGRLYSENKANREKASTTAIQGFEDGLFRVLVNDTEYTDLDGQLVVQEGDVLTFIRLTFLAGRLW